jgi:hypothetical protein
MTPVLLPPTKGPHVKSLYQLGAIGSRGLEGGLWIIGGMPLKELSGPNGVK